MRTLSVPRALRAALLAVVASLVLLPFARPAAAHSEVGELTVTTAEAEGSDAVVLQVGLVYANDGHLATEATVTATGTSSEGASLGPVALPSQADPDQPDEESALYGATVTVPEPGSWTFEITAENPAANASTTVEVSPTTTTAEPDPATEAGDDGSATDEPLLTATANDDDEGSGGSTGVIIAVVVAVVVVAAVVAVVVTRRRSAGS